MSLKFLKAVGKVALVVGDVAAPHVFGLARIAVGAVEQLVEGRQQGELKKKIVMRMLSSGLGQMRKEGILKFEGQQKQQLADMLIEEAVTVMHDGQVTPSELEGAVQRVAQVTVPIVLDLTVRQSKEQQ